jgi:hypothetical protein
VAWPSADRWRRQRVPSNILAGRLAETFYRFHSPAGATCLRTPRSNSYEIYGQSVLNLWRSWWGDPVASSAIVIAFVGGFFALYQLRGALGDRRRRILDAMVQQYGNTASARGQMLRECPRLFSLAYLAVKDAIDSEITSKEEEIQDQDAGAAEELNLKLRHLYRLRKEAETWMRDEVGISYTSAAEMLDSEFKMRALVWCIEVLREPSLWQQIGYTYDLTALCVSAVAQLNNFALDYENGTYPARTMLGQLHRSIAPAVKVLEPIIWERSIDGRWGRRVLRLGLAAQHFNDVVRIHRSSDLLWRWSDSAKDKVVVHPAKATDIFGQEVLRANIPGQPRLLPGVRLQFRTFYWWLVGKAALRPGSTLWTYGGARLRRHRKQEDQLAACLRFGMKKLKSPGCLWSLSFNWTVSSLREGMVRTAKKEKSSLRGGLASWIYQRDPSR